MQTACLLFAFDQGWSGYIFRASYIWCVVFNPSALQAPPLVKGRNWVQQINLFTKLKINELTKSYGTQINY